MIPVRNAPALMALSSVAVTQPLSHAARSAPATGNKTVSLRGVATEIGLIATYVLLLAATPFAIAAFALARAAKRVTKAARHL